MTAYVHFSEQPDPTIENLRIKLKKSRNLEMLMNYMNSMELESREPLNDNAVVSRITLQDEGEIIIIEGRYVAVDKNNNRVKKSFDYNTPIWLVGEYA
mgnify:CR=1 FL=1